MSSFFDYLKYDFGALNFSRDDTPNIETLSFSISQFKDILYRLNPFMPNDFAINISDNRWNQYSS